MTANKVYVVMQGLVNNLAARTARTAVISPLAIRQRSCCAADIVGAAITVQQRWHARITALLRAANSIFGTGKTSFQKSIVAKRCLPCGLTYTQNDAVNKWWCKMPAICPWCYSRTVQDLYHRAIHAMAVPGRELHGVHFSEYTAPFQRDEADETDSRLHRYRDVIKHHVMVNHLMKLSLGAWWAVSAEPDPKETEGGMLKLTARALFVVEKDVDLVLPQHWKRNIHVAPTFSTVAQEVSRVCRYPSGMLYGDVDMATNILRVRGARTPGCRRSSTNWSDYLGVLRKTVAPTTIEEPDDDNGIFEPSDLFTEFPDSL